MESQSLITKQQIFLCDYDHSKEAHIRGNNQELSNCLRHLLSTSRRQVQEISVKSLLKEKGWDITIYWE